MNSSEITYRLATASDAESLAALRLAFLAEISGGSKDDANLRQSLKKYFSTGDFVGFVAVAETKIIATSGLAFHQHPPSNKNPTGREAYIMNMYTMPEFRRRGIATKLLLLLIDHARKSRCGKISLHVLPQGNSIYKAAGFVSIETEMRINLV